MRCLCGCHPASGRNVDLHNVAAFFVADGESMARQAVLEISTVLLLHMAQGRYAVTRNAIPRDVEVMALSADLDTIRFVLQHPSFADVPDGALIPRIEGPWIRRLGDA